MAKILIHVCCAHCAAYTAEHWRRQGYDVTGFWYNPNIHPFLEHQQRLESAKSLAKETDFPLIIADGYDMIEFFRRVVGHETERCRDCFDLRLTSTASVAKEKGFDAFTTTLLISPHQNHELIRETGEKAAAAHGVAFLYTDLRKRYSDSRHITRPMNLYRQQYCGCLYSERERYTQEEKKGA
jgi:predicted adenine nucleotide alpha hydrolase (AANH) superfamily ATPase